MSSAAKNLCEYDAGHFHHEEICQKLRPLHEIFNGVIQAPKEVKVLLDEFEETVMNHFAHEEFGGFFNSVIRLAPNLEGEANRLSMEHHLLRSLIADLCEFAASGTPSTAWWRELAARCHALGEKLIQHESGETALHQLALNQAR